MPGHFALILRAHLPFVHHLEHQHFLGEEWLFEAITETYIPLLRMMQRLVDDFVPRQRGRRPSHAIPKPAAKSGVRAKAIPATVLTGIFIATSVSIFPWNIWGRSRGEPENSPV